eukprot:Sspe_Gene.52865::Locus_29271_Transcript_1_1_Confidence_1.000_Length_2783::g.52865::m.52865
MGSTNMPNSADRPEHSFLSIQGLSISLSVCLVVFTGFVVGFISITTGNRAIEDARDTGNKGVSDSLESGTHNVEIVAGQLMDRIAVGVRDAFLGFVATPHVVSKNLFTYLKGIDDVRATDPKYIQSILKPQITAMAMAVGIQGVSSISYYPQPYCSITDTNGHAPIPQGDGKWGGHFQVGIDFATIGMPHGERYLSVESQGPDGSFHNNDTYVVYGDVNSTGHLYTLDPSQPCNWVANWSRKEHMGKCLVPWTLVQESAYSHISDRAIYNAQTADGIMDPPDMMHWSPPITITNMLTVYAYSSWTHPNMPNKLGPRQGNRVGFFMVGIRVEQLSIILGDLVKGLPHGAVLYAVQVDPWTRKVGTTIGVSRGSPKNSTKVGASTRAYPVQIDRVDDPIIAAHGKHVLNTEGMYEAEWNSTKSGLATWIDPNGTIYFVKVQFIKREKLEWYTVTLIPRASILHTIDEATQKIRKSVDEATKESQRKKDEAFIVMIIVVVVISAVLLVLSVVLTRLIIAPLLVLEKDMEAVALMRLESVNLNSISYLGEVGRMQVSFRQMVSNLAEFRNYMHQSALVGTEDDSGEEVLHSPTLSSESSRGPGMDSRNSSGSTTRMTNSSHKNVKVVGMINDGLKRRQVTFLVFNVCDWHQTIGGMGDVDVLRLHSDIISSVVHSISSSKGVADVFSGDHLLGNFNQAKPCGIHRVAACSAALAITGWVDGYQPTQPLKISMSITSGDTRTGNMGCTGMKRHTALSPALSWCYALERVSRKYGTPCMVDHYVKLEAENEFNTRIIDVAEYPKRSRKPIRMHELRSRKTVQDQEWLYQIEEANAMNPYKLWNQCMEAIIANPPNWKDAADAMMRLQPGTVPERALLRARKCIEDRVHNPVTFDYI